MSLQTLHLTRPVLTNRLAQPGRDTSPLYSTQSAPHRTRFTEWLTSLGPRRTRTDSPDRCRSTWPGFQF